jgi:hypothetical protein
MTFRTTFRETRKSRQIALIVIFREKYARRILAIVSTTSISNRPPKKSGGLCGPLSPGARLDADHPENGVLIPCRFTGELRGPVDCDDEMELALSGSNLGDVDMEKADRVGLELALGRGFAFDLRKPRNPVALKTAMQRRARQIRNCRLKRVETVVVRQQSMPSEGDHDRRLFNSQDG